MESLESADISFNGIEEKLSRESHLKNIGKMMRHTIYIKQFRDDKDHSLEIEVYDDGMIIEAHAYLPIFDEWVDCTDKIKRSQFFRDKVQEELNEIKRGKEDYLAEKQLSINDDR